MDIASHSGGQLTITDPNGNVIYDGPVQGGLTPITPSLDVARDGSSYEYWAPWGRSFEYRITADFNEL